MCIHARNKAQRTHFIPSWKLVVMVFAGLVLQGCATGDVPISTPGESPLVGIEKARQLHENVTLVTFRFAHDTSGDKVLAEGKVEAIGPILIGIDAAVHDRDSGVDLVDAVAASTSFGFGAPSLAEIRGPNCSMSFWRRKLSCPPSVSISQYETDCPSVVISATSSRDWSGGKSQSLENEMTSQSHLAPLNDSRRLATRSWSLPTP